MKIYMSMTTRIYEEANKLDEQEDITISAFLDNLTIRFLIPKLCGKTKRRRRRKRKTKKNKRGQISTIKYLPYVLFSLAILLYVESFVLIGFNFFLNSTIVNLLVKSLFFFFVIQHVLKILHIYLNTL